MHFFQKRIDEMQSYAINQVQVFCTSTPFCISTFANISNSNEEENTFSLVVIHFSQIFDLPRPTFKAKSAIPRVL